MTNIKDTTLPELLAAVTAMRDAERAKVKPETLDEMTARLNLERASRIKLSTVPGALVKTEIIEFEEICGHEWLQIPAGLDLAGKLRIIDIYLIGIEAGKREGRYDLQRDLLDLLGAQRHE